MHYLEIPSRIVKELGGKFKGRYVCTVNGKVSFQCGMMALGDGKGYVMLSKKRMTETSLRKNASAKITLVPDRSRYGVEMPKEVSEIFRQDKEAKKRFNGLTPGKQRTILYYIKAVKNPDRRVERALQLIDTLKSLPPGKELLRDLFRKDPPQAVRKDEDFSQFATWEEAGKTQ